MLTKMDQNTIAKMTAALEYVCKKIPPDKDSNELRKRIGDAIVECANSRNGSLSDFQNAGYEGVRGDHAAAESQLAWPGSAIQIRLGRGQRRSLALLPHQGGAFGCSTT